MLQEFIENGKINTSLGERLLQEIINDLSTMEFNMLYYWVERGLISKDMEQKFILSVLERDKVNEE